MGAKQIVFILKAKTKSLILLCTNNNITSNIISTLKHKLNYKIKHTNSTIANDIPETSIKTKRMKVMVPSLYHNVQRMIHSNH